MPKGKKKCKSCGEFVGNRVSVCGCGNAFPKAKARKKAKPFFKERKSFVKRMLCGQKSENMNLDMMVATKVFDDFDNDISFLSSVSPPFKMEHGIRYLLTEDGNKYLTRKKLEFDYEPPEIIKITEHKEKSGEDKTIQKNKTLRDFLNNE